MIWRRTKPSTAEAEKPKGFDDFDLRLGDVMRGERATLGKSLLDVQRELKIKATYIAAIENCDISAFETPGFVAGYVRSYARYLGMDADDSFRRFCAEANFQVAHGMSAAASTAAVMAVRNRASGEPRDPLSDPNASFVPRGESVFAQVEPRAVVSLMVLLLLIGGIGYGGWAVLQEVQRVQLAPVDQAPSVVAEIDPLGNVDGTAPIVRSAPEAAGTVVADVTSDALIDRLYRPEALDVPVMVPRDGPIAAINTGQAGVDAAAADPQASAIELALAEATTETPQVTEAVSNAVRVIAVRPAWIEVTSPDGTVLWSGTLDKGQIYEVPLLEQAPLLRAGNSGDTYLMLDGKTYGPVASDGRVAKNIDLSAEAVTTAYNVVDPDDDQSLREAIRAVADASSVLTGQPATD